MHKNTQSRGSTLLCVLETFIQHNQKIHKAVLVCVWRTVHVDMCQSCRSISTSFKCSQGTIEKVLHGEIQLAGKTGFTEISPVVVSISFVEQHLRAAERVNMSWCHAFLMRATQTIQVAHGFLMQLTLVQINKWVLRPQ